MPLHCTFYQIFFPPLNGILMRTEAFGVTLDIAKQECEPIPKV